MSLEISELPICNTTGHAWVKISVGGKPGRPQWVGIDGSADSIVVDEKYEMKPADWNSDDFHYTARQIGSKSDSDTSIEVYFYKQSENVVETDIDTINSIAMVHFYYHLCYELCAAHCLKGSNWMNVINCFEKVKPAGMDPDQFEKIIDNVKTMMIDDDLASDD